MSSQVRASVGLTSCRLRRSTTPSIKLDPCPTHCLSSLLCPKSRVFGDLPLILCGVWAGRAAGNLHMFPKCHRCPRVCRRLSSAVFSVLPITASDGSQDQWSGIIFLQLHVGQIAFTQSAKLSNAAAISCLAYLSVWTVYQSVLVEDRVSQHLSWNKTSSFPLVENDQTRKCFVPPNDLCWAHRL